MSGPGFGMSTILGAANLLEQISQHWGSSSLPMPIVLLSTSLLLLLLGSLAAVRWYRTLDHRSMPLVIFMRIARDCDLSLLDQWLLWRIARAQALPTPLTLLLSLRTLHYHARAYVDNAGTGRRGRVLARVWRIRRVLTHRGQPPGNRG